MQRKGRESQRKRNEEGAGAGHAGHSGARHGLCFGVSLAFPTVKLQVAMTRPSPPHWSCHRRVQGAQASCGAEWEGAGPGSSAAPTSKLKQRGRGPGLGAPKLPHPTSPLTQPAGPHRPRALQKQDHVTGLPCRSRLRSSASGSGGAERGALSQTPREHGVARKP